MKKLISTIMAFTVACTGFAATNAGAIAARPFDLNSDEFAGYEELYHIDSEHPYSIFIEKCTTDDGSTVYHYRYVDYKPGFINLKTYDGGDTPDERITDILSSYEVDCRVEDYGNGTYLYIGSIPDNFPYIREIYNKIAEISHLSDFYIRGGGIYASGSGYIPFVSPTRYELSEKQIASLTEYVMEKNLDFTIERGKLVSEACAIHDDLYIFELIPNYDIEFDEHLQIAADIATTLGINIPIVYQSSAGTVVSGSGNIDVLNSMDGDANEDGDMNIADATAIVQAIGNKDKYGLTAQGEFNADLDGNGLTGADAVAIQQKLVEMGMPE
ncbi:MAG: dockerin type I repeat-containing protein [Ruminococcus sp.]|nr:dockerin type I repeat-containing protein [Ruminococcus sp.]